MTDIVEEDEAFDPSDVGLFRPMALMAHPNRLPDPIEKPGILLPGSPSLNMHVKTPPICQVLNQ